MWRFFGRAYLGAALVVAVTIGGTAALGDIFLSQFLGIVIYAPAALALNILGFSTAFALAGRKTSKPVPFITRLAVVPGVLATSLASLILVPIAAERIIYAVYHADPIGVGDDVGRASCQTRSTASVSSRNGLIADVRETYCSGTWDGVLMYFVFVHKPSGADTKQTLVFRYTADTPTPPTVVWDSKGGLAIAAAANVLEITYMLLYSNDISIKYGLGSDSRPQFTAVTESVVGQ